MVIYMYYLNCFFVYSILGHLLETIVALITKTNFKSGFLFGWWTPVYGVGTVIILFISEYLFKNMHMNRIVESIVAFFVIAIVLSFIEALGGVLLEKIFNISFWDYNAHKYHIGKYISLEMTFMWGIASMIFIYLVNPLLEKIIRKIPSWVTITLIILFISDCCYTFVNKKNLK